MKYVSRGFIFLLAWCSAIPLLSSCNSDNAGSITASLAPSSSISSNEVPSIPAAPQPQAEEPVVVQVNQEVNESLNSSEAHVLTQTDLDDLSQAGLLAASDSETLKPLLKN